MKYNFIVSKVYSFFYYKLTAILYSLQIKEGLPFTRLSYKCVAFSHPHYYLPFSLKRSLTYLLFFMVVVLCSGGFFFVVVVVVSPNEKSYTFL